MSRNHSFEALVLRQYPLGEVHRAVIFLTRERGLLNAVAHGAAKSQNKLKLLTSPYRQVVLKAYHDPVADSWKVIDLEEVKLFAGLSEDLDRSLTAALWAELALKTLGSGEEKGVFDLLAEGFSILERVQGQELRRLNVQVLWRFLEISGLLPDFSVCDSCGRPLSGLIIGFVPETAEAFCPDCSPPEALLLPVQAVDYLLSTGILGLEESLAAPLDEAALGLLLRSAASSLQRALGAELKSLKTLRMGNADR